MDLVPSAAAIVLQVILQRLPHKRFEKETHQQFLHSVFRIAETPQGAPIRDGLLLGVIDRLLEVRALARDAKQALPRCFLDSMACAGGRGDQVRGPGRHRR